MSKVQKKWRAASSAIRIVVTTILLASCPVEAVFAAPPPLTFAVGDQLQVSFYEPFNNDAKWAALGQVREPGPSYYLHDELSGSYSVASDSTISLPIIGDVVVANRTAAEVETILEQDFKNVVGHPGFVNISITARTPLYILGLVNRPGVYPFKPNMTPLDLVALAGGYKTSLDTQSSIQAIKEGASEASALDQLRNALAQLAVLQAQASNTPAAAPQQLVDLMGRSGADAMVQSAENERRAVLQNQTEQVAALQSAVDAAQSTFVADEGRLKPTKGVASLRQARLSSLKSLSEDGLAAQPEIEDAQAAALDSQDRQQDVLVAIAADQHQLVLARSALQSLVSGNQADLNQQLATQQAEINSLTPQVAASAEVVKLLSSPDGAQAGDVVQFSIVRGGQLITADIATGLQPGDVLQVAAPASGPAPAVATAAPAAPPQPGASSSSPQQLAGSTCPAANGCF